MYMETRPNLCFRLGPFSSSSLAYCICAKNTTGDGKLPPPWLVESCMYMATWLRVHKRRLARMQLL